MMYLIYDLYNRGYNGGCNIGYNRPGRYKSDALCENLTRGYILMKSKQRIEMRRRHIDYNIDYNRDYNLD